MNRWQRNHFKLMTLLEWREDRLSNAVERLLLRGGRKYRKADYVPTVRQMVQQMEPLNPMIRNLVQVAGIVGATEAVVKSNYDLRTKWKSYFRHGSLPDRVTLDMIVNYLETVGVDRGALAAQMEAHTRRMSDTIARLAEKKIRQNVVEATSQKWTLKRSMDQMQRTFDGLKRKDVESVMPNVATVVRTESMTILHASSWHSSQNTPALQSLLWGFEYWAAGDARTRPTHDAQDGVTAEVDSPFWNHWYPPNGYNCRCSAIPLYDEPTTKKTPRWDLQPDKGFDFNPGKNGPFFTPVPRNNTIPAPKQERHFAKKEPPTAPEPVREPAPVSAPVFYTPTVPQPVPVVTVSASDTLATSPVSMPV
ncbi:MAG: phage minor head protein, partial [Planctomycetia bacterium]|nr:phage minor head protein [Planctomycetia bacterium]